MPAHNPPIEEYHLPAGTLLLTAFFNGEQTQRAAEQAAIGWLVLEKLGEQATIEHEPSGRPRLTGMPAPISIAHTIGWAALLVGSEGTICGVDIEPIARCATRASQRIASPAEIRLAERHFPLNPELLVWCAKEAAYKAAGRKGMNLLQDIVLTDAPQAGELTVRVDAITTVNLSYFTTPVINPELLVVAGAFQLDSTH